MANIPVNYASINDTEAYFELLKNNNSNEVDERFIPLKGDKSDCSFMIRIFNRIQTFLDNNPTLDAEYTIFLNEMKTFIGDKKYEEFHIILKGLYEHYPKLKHIYDKLLSYI